MTIVKWNSIHRDGVWMGGHSDVSIPEHVNVHSLTLVFHMSYATLRR
jgi:hypothetical protein